MGEENRNTPAAGRGGGGEGGPVDRALSARGLTTRRLRLRAAAAVSALVAAAAGVLLYTQTNVLGPDSVCAGVVDAAAVHAALGPGRVGETWLDEKAATVYNQGSWCTVTVRHGVFGATERSATLSLRLDTQSAVTRAAADARLFAGSANGGSTGGAGGGAAWALLPSGCAAGLRVELSTGGDRPNGDRAEGLARLAVDAANGAAAKNHCGQGALPAPKALSAGSAVQPVDTAALCGLPGLAATPKDSPAAAGYRQQATTAFDPLWSCAITGGHDGSRVLGLAVATEPRLSAMPAPPTGSSVAYGRARWTDGGGGREAVATCQGRPVYFSVDLKQAREVEGVLFTDRAELWQRFLASAGRAIGCEPIVP